jgi:hypothetical protein
MQRDYARRSDMKGSGMVIGFTMQVARCGLDLRGPKSDIETVRCTSRGRAPPEIQQRSAHLPDRQAYFFGTKKIS